MAVADGWMPGEQRVLRRIDTPQKIQKFLDDDIAYNLEPTGATCLSPRTVLKERRAHCMEGALFAAAALEFHGDPALLVDLEAVHDTDHVLAVFQRHGHWGAIAKSNFSGLRFREPVYRTLRELVMSYFDHYYNLRGEKTLRAYSRPVRLSRFGRRWTLSEEQVWFVPEYLCEIPHIPILADGIDRRLGRMDRRLFAAGRLGAAH